MEEGCSMKSVHTTTRLSCLKHVNVMVANLRGPCLSIKHLGVHYPCSLQTIIKILVQVHLQVVFPCCGSHA